MSNTELLVTQDPLCGCCSAGHITVYCAKHDPNPVVTYNVITPAVIGMNKTERYMLAFNIFLSLVMLAVMATQIP